MLGKTCCYYFVAFFSSLRLLSFLAPSQLFMSHSKKKGRPLLLLPLAFLQLSPPFSRSISLMLIGASTKREGKKGKLSNKKVGNWGAFGIHWYSSSVRERFSIYISWERGIFDRYTRISIYPKSLKGRNGTMGRFSKNIDNQHLKEFFIYFKNSSQSTSFSAIPLPFWRSDLGNNGNWIFSPPGFTPKKGQNVKVFKFCWWRRVLPRSLFAKPTLRNSSKPSFDEATTLLWNWRYFWAHHYAVRTRRAQKKFFIGDCFCTHS